MDAQPLWILALMFPLGFGVATLGTLVGAGGGFLLLPILMALNPTENPDHLTAVSLAMIFANALSGTVAYIRMKRVDYRSGVAFMLAALPGAYFGAKASSLIDRVLFDRVLGSALVVLASFLLFRAYVARLRAARGPSAASEHGRFRPSNGAVAKGSLLSTLVGFLSSLLGIGGGIIHVPALIYLLGFPVHIATATSHFVLACTSGIAVFEHIQDGSYVGYEKLVFFVATGALCGAQLGARLSPRVKGQTIMVGLAFALILAGGRMVIRSFAVG